MIRFYKTPWITKRRYPELVWQLPSRNTLYLTFDDGPNPTVTPWVINELRKVDAKATFFCLGSNIQQHQNLAKALIEEGHAIGNHTQNHLDGWKTLSSEYQDDILKCDEELMNLGVHNQLFRPPYGRIKKSQIKKLRNRKIIMWSHLSWDFDGKSNTQQSIEKLKKAEEGSILVFHDSAKAFENLQVILPEILSFFSAKGFKFDSVR
ncbi:MAG: polysaccharide deacetylase family protein [Ekhidna sp.]